MPTSSSPSGANARPQTSNSAEPILYHQALDRAVRRNADVAGVVDDLDDLKNVATAPLRRKLHAVLTSQRELKPRVVQEVAKRVGQTIAIRKGALVVPTGQAEFREFVRLLADDYLESPQDHARLYLTTSKKRVEAR